MGEVGVESQIWQVGAGNIVAGKAYMLPGGVTMTFTAGTLITADGETFDVDDLAWEAERAGREASESFVRGLEPFKASVVGIVARAMISKMGIKWRMPTMREQRRSHKRWLGRHTRWIEEGRARNGL